MAQQSRTRFLSLDVGDRRIGVAAGSMETGLARPLEIIDRSRGDALVWRRLRELVKEEKAGAILVGDPLNMDGSVGPRAEVSRQFANWLRGAIRQVNVILQDERLSTFAAEEWMDRDGVKPSKRDAWRDAYAAAVILADFLQAKRDAAAEE